MRNVSIHVGWFIGALLGITGCLKEVGLGPSAGSGGASIGGMGGLSVGSGGSAPAAGGIVGMGGSAGSTTPTGTSWGSGGSAGSTTTTGTPWGTGGSAGTTTTGTSWGSGGSSTGTGTSAPACGLGGTPVSCNFSHLNADCAPYGAVCDYVFGQCSCCFLHETVSCATDADCQATVGASAYCASGTCACK